MELANLETLEVVYEDFWFFEYLSCGKKLNTLHLVASDFVREARTDPIVKFLNKLKLKNDIEDLRLGNVDLNNSDTQLEIKFKWKSLNIIWDLHLEIIQRHSENWRKLCESSVKNAKLSLNFAVTSPTVPLMINWCANINHLYIAAQDITEETVTRLENLQRIESLEIFFEYNSIWLRMRNRDEIIDDGSRYSLLFPRLTKIKTFAIDDRCFSDMDQEIFQMNLQNVTKFILKRSYGSDVEDLGEVSLQGIEHLNENAFPHLNSLEICGFRRVKKFGGFQILSTLNRYHPTLKHVSIKFSEDCHNAEDDMEKFMKKTLISMSNVEKFEFRWSYQKDIPQPRRRRYFRKTVKASRAELEMKFFNERLSESMKQSLADIYILI